MLTRTLALALATSVAVSGQSISTVFGGGNSGTTTWTNQFDIQVLNPAGITILGFDVNCENTRAGGVGSPFSLGVWITLTAGTYVGNETNPSAWLLVASGNGVSLAQGNPTPVDVTDFHLAPGSYGIALEYNGTAMAYTNGNGTNQTFANADLSLSLGASTTGLFGAPVYSPRVWNGTIHYFNGTARWWPFGEGCAGTGGIPTIAPAAGSLPRLGTNFTVEFGNLAAPGTAVVALIGASRSQWGATPLPLDLTPLGASGCDLAVSPDATATVVSGPSIASLSLLVPPLPNLVGAALHWQGAVLDFPANPLGIITTAAGTSYLGN
jgi:hypothetical protein